MANAGFLRHLTHERTVGDGSRPPSVPRTVFAGLVLTVVGVVIVWLFMFLLAHG